MTVRLVREEEGHLRVVGREHLGKASQVLRRNWVSRRFFWGAPDG